MSAIEGWLQGPAGPIVAIAAMAFVTYLCRIGGALIMSRVRLTPIVERALAALPGSIVAATVVPIAIKSGLAAILAIVVAVVVTRLTHSEIAALSTALVIAALARLAGL